MNALLDELQFRVHGSIHGPGEPEYDDACTLFNSMIETRPRLVVRCASPDDVAAALHYARERGLDVAVRGGGHSVTGRSLCDGLVLDMRAMNEVSVDRERRIARVGGGATWSDVDRATGAHGLATTGGRVSTTGVAGLTVGGGSGWLERSHGLACDNLLAGELVTAGGELVRADADQNSELLWALRGGGANFGVITALEFRVHPIESQVLGGLVLHHAERAHELLSLFRDEMKNGPDELGLAFAFFTGPEEDGVPSHLVGEPCVAIAGMYNGSVAEGEEALRAIREFGPPEADFFEPTTYADFNCSLDDPPGFRNYWNAATVHDLPDGAIATVAERAKELDRGPSQVFIVPWGGQVARVAPETSPLAGRDVRFIVHPLLLWESPARDERNIALGRAFREDLRPFASGDAYLNFEGEGAHAMLDAAYGESNHERLARVKAEWDPDNVFHGNQSLQPAGAPA